MTKFNNQFRIELPDGWEDQTVHYFLGPDDSGVQHSLTVFVDSNPETDELEEYARVRIDQAIEALPDVEILKEEIKTLESGVNAYIAISKWIPPEGKPSFRKQVYIMRDNIAYTFSSDFSKKTLKTIGAEVDMMINSFIPGESE
jgi:hypothetical protein